MVVPVAGDARPALRETEQRGPNRNKALRGVAMSNTTGSGGTAGACVKSLAHASARSLRARGAHLRQLPAAAVTLGKAIGNLLGQVVEDAEVLAGRDLLPLQDRSQTVGRCWMIPFLVAKHLRGRR